MYRYYTNYTSHHTDSTMRQMFATCIQLPALLTIQLQQKQMIKPYQPFEVALKYVSAFHGTFSISHFHWRYLMHANICKVLVKICAQYLQKEFNSSRVLNHIIFSYTKPKTFSVTVGNFVILQESRKWCFYKNYLILQTFVGLIHCHLLCPINFYNNLN